MDRTNGRTFKQKKYDTKHYPNHDRSHLGLQRKIKEFKTHPCHNHSYSTFCEYRISTSGSYKSIKTTSIEKKSANLTSEQIAHKLFVASCGSFENCLAKERSSCHLAATHGSSDYTSTECRLTNHETAEHISVDIPSSTNHRTTNHNSAKFPSQDDILKCLLMKVYPIIQPKLKRLLHCIFNDKQDSDTLELYAIKQGMDSKWQKRFSEEQIKNIRQSPDFSAFDSTLIFRCIEVLRDFNPTLIKNEKLKLHIDNTMKELKYPRNLLCHNRKNLTDKQCREISNSLKKPLEDLLQIIYIWDREINITNEKMKIWEEIKAVMNGGLSEEEFRYMCLLKVINCNVTSVLQKVTKLICYDKEENENYKEYLKRKGMNARTYKDTFYKEEQEFLKSYSEEAQHDLTLHCKIIETSRKWHPSLKDNENNKKLLTNILKKLRGVRNYAIHNMLSMSSDECIVKSQEMGDSLKDLVDLVNIIQNKKSDMTMDAAKININKNKSDISSIMAVPCTSV